MCTPLVCTSALWKQSGAAWSKGVPETSPSVWDLRMVGDGEIRRPKKKLKTCRRVTSFQRRAEKLLENCSTLLQELEDLEAEFYEFWRSIRPFKGVTIFLARPIHSM